MPAPGQVKSLGRQSRKGLRQMEIWDLWYPNAAAQGLSFGRCRLKPAEVVWVHSAPDALRVEVREDDGALLASGDQLRRTSEISLPMTRLSRAGRTIVRADEWPGADDIGRVVLLPGGEAGILTSWWHAGDGSEWRWSVEFYNHR
ncbi:MAG: DUF7712 family protein [Dehalococcoidia bacterium]